jgi:hypothetical protein
VRRRGNLDGSVTGLPETMVLVDHGFHPLVALAAEQLSRVLRKPPAIKPEQFHDALTPARRGESQSHGLRRQSNHRRFVRPKRRRIAK